MAFVRQGCALALSLTLWAVAALAEDQAPAAPTGLYDRLHSTADDLTFQARSRHQTG